MLPDVPRQDEQSDKLNKNIDPFSSRNLFPPVFDNTYESISDYMKSELVEEDSRQEQHVQPLTGNTYASIPDPLASSHSPPSKVVSDGFPSDNETTTRILNQFIELKHHQ